MRRRCSEITLPQAIDYCSDFCPFRIYYNKELLWDDEHDWPFEFIRNSIKDFDSIVITDIKIKIDHFHHSIIYFKGRVEK
jgi:hypothetical protein